MFQLVFSPALRRAGLLFLSATLLPLGACKDDQDDITPHAGHTTQPITLEFEHLGSDGEPLAYGRTYTTALGAPYVVDSLKYYVSNVKLTRADGTVWTAPPAYYLVRATSAPADNVVLEILDVPLGDYSAVTFSVGVDSLTNRTGDHSGVLNASYGMQWVWNTGYTFLAFTGKYQPAGSAPTDVLYFLGGDAVYRPMTVTLPFPTAATVTTDITPEAHVEVQVDKLFSGPTKADFTVPEQQIVMGVDTRVAANVAGMFRVEHVHNEKK